MEILTGGPCGNFDWLDQEFVIFVRLRKKLDFALAAQRPNGTLLVRAALGGGGATASAEELAAFSALLNRRLRERVTDPQVCTVPASERGKGMPWCPPPGRASGRGAGRRSRDRGP